MGDDKEMRLARNRLGLLLDLGKHSASKRADFARAAELRAEQLLDELAVELVAPMSSGAANLLFHCDTLKAEVARLEAALATAVAERQAAERREVDTLNALGRIYERARKPYGGWNGGHHCDYKVAVQSIHDMAAQAISARTNAVLAQRETAAAPTGEASEGAGNGRR